MRPTSRMNGQAAALIERTDRFAIEIARLIRTFCLDEPGPTAKRQLSKAATSVAANHRAARRSRSHTEFTARIAVVAEEADETLYWLSFAKETGLTASGDLAQLTSEANELTAIFSAMVGTARREERKRAARRTRR